MHKNKVLFIDAIGCLIFTTDNSKIPKYKSAWRFNDSALEKIKYYFDKDYTICIISNVNVNSIVRPKFYEETFDLIIKELCKIFPKIPILTIYYKNADNYFKYPNPGGIFNFCIENDVALEQSLYYTKNDEAFIFSRIYSKLTH